MFKIDMIMIVVAVLTYDEEYLWKLKRVQNGKTLNFPL